MNAKSTLAIVMGIIILVADLYWLFGPGASYTVPLWLGLGIVILIADLIWLAIDASYMRGPSEPRKKMTDNESVKSAQK